MCDHYPHGIRINIACYKKTENSVHFICHKEYKGGFYIRLTDLSLIVQAIECSISAILYSIE